MKLVSSLPRPSVPKRETMKHAVEFLGALFALVGSAYVATEGVKNVRSSAKALGAGRQAKELPAAQSETSHPHTRAAGE